MKYFTNLFPFSIFTKYLQLTLTSALLFMVLFNQNIIRTIKNSLVVTLIEPEIISFIKLYMEVPITFAILIGYVKLYSFMSASRIFSFTLIIFAVIFFIFSFFILPNLEFYTLDNSIVEYVTLEHPHLKWVMKLLQNWSLVMFYVVGELWTAIIYSLLLWELINRITTVKNSRTYYPIFNIFGQFSTVISGILIIYLFNHNTIKEASMLQSIDSIQLLIFIVILSIICMFFIHRFMSKTYCNGNEYKKVHDILDNTKSTIIENLRFILSSNYVLLISINVMCYSVTIMIVEGLWFAKSRELYSSAEDFINYQSQVLIFIGITTLFFSGISNYLTPRIHWFSIASITPYVFVLFGTIFILSCIMEHRLLFSILEFSSLPIMIFLGSLANVLGKGAKYAFFDTTKEMCYVPLDNALKAKAKAVIDVFCFHFGKMLGALLPFIIFSIFPDYTYSDIKTYLLVIFVIVCVIWILTIRRLSLAYNCQVINTSI